MPLLQAFLYADVCLQVYFHAGLQFLAAFQKLLDLPGEMFSTYSYIYLFMFIILID